MGAPSELFCKIAGKIDPVLSLAGKMKYICSETCLENVFVKWAYLREAANIVFRTLDNH